MIPANLWAPLYHRMLAELHILTLLAVLCIMTALAALHILTLLAVLHIRIHAIYIRAHLLTSSAETVNMSAMSVAAFSSAQLYGLQQQHDSAD